MDIQCKEFQAWLTGARAIAKWDLEISEGDKYLKIIKLDKVTKEVQPLPYAFIDRNTGVVYLGVNWRFPSTKFGRGCIFDEDNGISKLGPDSPLRMHNGCPKGYKHGTPKNQPEPKVTEVRFELMRPLISVPKTSGYSPTALPTKISHENLD